MSHIRLRYAFILTLAITIFSNLHAANTHFFASTDSTTMRSLSWRKTEPIARHKLGIAFSHSINRNTDTKNNWSTPYYFRVHLYKLQYGYVFWRATRSTHLEVLLQPQFNTALYSPNNDTHNIRRTFELGLNIGLVIRQQIIGDRLSVYGLIAAGPHYAHRVPPRASRGFTFSDNLGLGISAKVYKRLYVDFRVVWRHMSNAQLKLPNGRIENLLMNYAVYYNF